MAATVSSNKRGFTLLELMISVFILTIGLLALFQSVNIAIVHNINNQFREEGVSVGDVNMSNALAKPFDLISTTTKIDVQSRPINNAFKNYSVTITGSQVTSNTKQVDVNVSWKSKGISYNHSFSSLVSKRIE